MVEPFSAVIFNTLLSSRSTSRYPPFLSSVARVTTRSPRSSTVSDFFVPQPRQLKGKEKAENTSCHLLQCQEWSTCAQQHLPWCPYQRRFMMLEELTSRHDRSSRYKSRQTLPRYNFPKVTLTTKTYGIGQRRHASHASELAQPIVLPAEDPLASSTDFPVQDASAVAIEELKTMSRAPPADFDLEYGWETYIIASKRRISLQLLLQFTDRLLLAAEKYYRLDSHLEQLHLWGRRAQSILLPLKSQISPHSWFDKWRSGLLARSMALVGDIQQAILLAHVANRIPVVDRYKNRIPYVFQTIMLSILRYQGKLAMVDFIAAEWMVIGPYLTQRSSEGYTVDAPLGRSMRITAFKIVAEIDDPAHLLVQKTAWNKERRESMGNFLIEALCFCAMPTDALEVLQEMRKQRLRTPSGLQLTLVRALVANGAFGPASTLYESIPNSESSKHHLSTGLYLNAQNGNAEKAEAYFKDLKDHGSLTSSDITMHLYSLARQGEGRKKQAHTLFNEHFPKGPDGKRLNSPTVNQYTAIIYAHSLQGDSEGISYWLGDMSKSGLAPDVYIFSLVLYNFALRNDMAAVMAILNDMRKVGINPNAVTYTMVITLLAHRKDAIGAESIFKSALEEGVVPDRRMITSVMNAHVEAGSWEGAIRTFDYIQSYPSRRIRVTIEVYNTLLKAYVLAGAPFQMVSKLFQKLDTSKTKPDEYTFALLIQSACDDGKMDVAADLFYEMDRLSTEDKERGIRITVFVLTILMAGFLRLGDKIKAKGVYDEMRDRGIQPTAITFGTLLKAYGNENVKESMQVAESFIKSLVDVPRKEQVWNVPTHGRKPALQHIYGPAIAAYAKQEKMEDVERLFQDMLNAGGSPSLSILTTILDAYRRTSNIDGILQLWPQIFQISLQQWKVHFENDTTHERPRGNILCAPLSIYIDALSSAGLHHEVTLTWQEFRNHKFSFDSHNWNHLVVALVRAGKPERAFEVVETVLLPYHQRQEPINPKRDTNPTTPLSTINELPSVEDSPSVTPLELPMHDGLRRASAVRLSTLKMSSMDIDSEQHEHEDDFAHPLHILRQVQVSPLWGTWRPHLATLSALLVALSRLESGSLVKPVLSNSHQEIVPAEDETLQAREMLNRIYKDYPNTVRAVLNHEVAEKRRLGDEYDEVYNWK